jgi:hypothetical protein
VTRSALRAFQRRLYLFLGLVLGVALFAKFADHVPGLKGTGLEALLKDFYEFARDMSLLIATGGVALVSNVYQKRANFIESLEEEWRRMVATKSALYAFCEKPFPTTEEYVAAFCRISETIDSMRIVYRNVGETKSLVGLYPYAPLHDMRRALQTLDPRKDIEITPEHRKLVRDAILQCFYALRETFLEELDLPAPDHPLLIAGARRLKRPGEEKAADAAKVEQRLRQNQTDASRPEIDTFLADLYQREDQVVRKRSASSTNGAETSGDAHRAARV